MKRFFFFLSIVSGALILYLIIGFYVERIFPGNIFSTPAAWFGVTMWFLAPAAIIIFLGMAIIISLYLLLIEKIFHSPQQRMKKISFIVVGVFVIFFSPVFHHIAKVNYKSIKIFKSFQKWENISDISIPEDIFVGLTFVNENNNKICHCFYLQASKTKCNIYPSGNTRLSLQPVQYCNDEKDYNNLPQQINKKDISSFIKDHFELLKGCNKIVVKIFGSSRCHGEILVYYSKDGKITSLEKIRYF